ncbi:MAG: hypothetical protein ABI465_20615 [Ktedonobacteraceae bacterium]
MTTQSVDTHPEAERLMIDVIRKAPVSKRFRLVQSLTQSVLWSSIHAWQESHQEVSEQEAAICSVSCAYGTTLAQRVQAALEMREQWHVQPADLVTSMLSVLRVFDELRAPSYLGGSIASSLHGMQQMAQDIDLVVDLSVHMLPALVALLEQHYVLDTVEARRAVRERTSFPLIHLDSLMKVDVILPQADGFDTAMRQQVARYTLDERYPPFQVASACEMILYKLQRYQRDERSRTDGMRDDAGWNDIVGMLKVQGPDLDLVFLERWAETLDIIDTWQRALVDAGLTMLE